MDEELRNSVREARTGRGWTQLELAEQAGVSRKTINTIENGSLNPSVLIALRLATALETTVDELFRLGRSAVDDQGNSE